MNEIVTAILGMFVSLLFGIGSNWVYDKLANTLSIFFKKKEKTPTYQEKISRLTENLSKASKEVDEVLKEISAVSVERAQGISELEKQLAELSNREQQTKARIEALEKIPLEAVQHLEKILDKGDKRSALRDYMLFGLGVVVSTIIAIALKLVGI